MRFALGLGLALLLTGCAGSLETLRAEAPEADDFENSLAAEYLGFSESEAEQGKRESAERFAAKGLEAHARRPVMPDTPSEGAAQQLRYRTQLLSVLTEDVKHVAPQKAARAQLLYDCWLAQPPGGEGALVPCRDEFLSTMNELQAVADQFIFGQELTHHVQFAEGSKAISPKAAAEIHAIADYVGAITNYVLLLTDLAGAEPSAQALAGARLQAVRALFIKAGIAPDHIQIQKRDHAKEVLLSSDAMEHNAIEIAVQTRSPGGQ